MLPGARQFFERRGAPAPSLPYDAEVEYIESTGTQYALTNIKPKVGDIYLVESLVQYASNVSSNTWLTGWWTGADCSSLFGTFQNQLYFTYNRDDNIARTNVGLYNKHRIRYNFPQGIFIDDTQLSSTVAANTPLTIIPNGSGFVGLSIFRSYSWPQDGYPVQTNIKAKLFNFSILINGVVVFDGIPVRFTNEQNQSEGAMYDRVSGQLFRNQGTGAFVVGPDVTPAFGYVQNGLIAMWDGIENAGWGVHDANATSWLDLIGNKQMPTTLSSLSWDSNALVRTGVDGLTYDTGLDFSDPLSERTFEFVISYDADYTDTTSNYFIARFNDFGTWLSFWNRMKFGISLYAGGGTNETPFEQPSFKGSVSLVSSSTPYVINPTQRHYAYYYANGTYFRDGAFGGGSSSSAVMELFAAARNWPSSNTIKMHSIRIYSRALTAAEIANNYAVDKERFNLP